MPLCCIPYVIMYVISVLSSIRYFSLPHVPSCKYAYQVQMTSAWRHKQLVPLKCPHDFSHKRLNSMQEGPSLAGNSSSASQGIYCTVWKRTVHYCSHKIVAFFYILNQMNQSHTLQCCLCKISFNIILQPIYIKYQRMKGFYVLLISIWKFDTLDRLLRAQVRNCRHVSEQSDGGRISTTTSALHLTHFFLTVAAAGPVVNGEMSVLGCLSFRKQKNVICLLYSRTPLIRTLVIRIGLTLRESLSRIYKTSFPWNCRLSDQVHYSVMASRTAHQAWL
jgi:hypothetical protein